MRGRFDAASVSKEDERMTEEPIGQVHAVRPSRIVNS
jgi:hypothetical protein